MGKSHKQAPSKSKVGRPFETYANIRNFFNGNSLSGKNDMEADSDTATTNPIEAKENITTSTARPFPSPSPSPAPFPMIPTFSSPPQEGLTQCQVVWEEENDQIEYHDHAQGIGGSSNANANANANAIASDDGKTATLNNVNYKKALLREFYRAKPERPIHTTAPAGDSFLEPILDGSLDGLPDDKNTTGAKRSGALETPLETPRSNFLRASLGNTSTGGGSTSLPMKRIMPRRSELKEEKKKKILELLDSLVTSAMGEGLGAVDEKKEGTSVRDIHAHGHTTSQFQQSWGDSDIDEGDLDFDALEAAAFSRRDKSNVNEEEEESSRNSVHYRICAVESHSSYETVLYLENPFTEDKVIAHLREPWNEQEYREGEKVNLIGACFVHSVPPPPVTTTAQESFASAQQCWLGRVGSTMSPTLLVHFPDLLLGGTRIASSLQCTRRGYLSERISREETPLEGSSSTFTAQARTRGNLYHALFQEALTNAEDMQNLNKAKVWLKKRAHQVACRSYLELFDAGMTEVEAEAYLVDESLWSIISFLKQFVNGDGGPARVQNNYDSTVTVGVSEVLDIEEYIASPKFGLKGYIDASVRVQIAEVSRFGDCNLENQDNKNATRSLVAPLELKTGRERDSDVAQLLLYLLMMEDRYGGPSSWGVLVHKGLPTPQLIGRNPDHLVYLMAARNRLAAALDWGAHIKPPPPLTDLAGACLRCYASRDCMLAHACAENGTAEGFVGGRVPPGSTEYQQLVGMYEEVAGHLRAREVEFMRHYLNLLDLEEAASKDLRHEAWSMSGDAREAVGRCLAGLTVSNVVQQQEETETEKEKEKEKEAGPVSPVRWLYTFSRSTTTKLESEDIDQGLAAEAFAPGDMVTVSIDGRHTGVARGHVVHVALSQGTLVGITVQLDKRIRPSLETGFHQTHKWRVDKEEIGSTIPRQRGFVYALFEKPHARLRNLVVDLHPPDMGSKDALPPEVHSIISAEATLSKLNAQQVEAIYAAVAAQDYALVLGMPGAGKTTTVVSMIRVLTALGLKVLLTSYTNSAVDNVLSKLVKVNSPGIKCVRVGRKGRVHPSLEPCMPAGSMHGADSVQALKSLSETVSVVGVPALGVTDPLVRRIQFDICIVDEAGQITVPAILGPLLRAPRFVLVGDPHQLPPLVTSKAAEEGGLSDPLFRRLAQAHPRAVVELSVQYRMAEDIQTLPNLLTYAGKLTCGCPSVTGGMLTMPMYNTSTLTSTSTSTSASAPIPHCTSLLHQALAPQNRVVFIDTPVDMVETVRGNAVVNRGEAGLVKRIVDALLSCGVESHKLGIISPYKAQVSVIAKLLGQDSPEVECLTVDKAQGRDKDCIIVSLVRCNKEQNGGKLLTDVRRLNVAITRARYKLILVGNSLTLNTIPLFATLFNECTKRGWVWREI